MANKKISELAEASTLDGSELVEAVQGGQNVQTTTQDIADLAAVAGGAPYREISISGVFTDQPAYSATEGYYIFQPEQAADIPRVYFIPNSPSTNGTKWKLEGFHTDYVAGSTNYAGFNIFGQTISGVHYTWIGPNTGGSGARGLLVIGSFSGSSQEANTSELRMTATDTWNMRGAGLNYELLNGTDIFGFNSSGALLLQGSAGSSGHVPISGGSGSPAAWGAPAGALDRVTASTAGSTITLDMNNQTQRVFVGSASFSGPKTVAMSNDSNGIALAFTVQVTNVAAVLTMPSSWVMSSVNFNGTDWTPPNTGYFKFAGHSDGTNWFINVAGPYS